jgi:hypothetical protein
MAENCIYARFLLCKSAVQQQGWARHGRLGQVRSPVPCGPQSAGAAVTSYWSEMLVLISVLNKIIYRLPKIRSTFALVSSCVCMSNQQHLSSAGWWGLSGSHPTGVLAVQKETL